MSATAAPLAAPAADSLAAALAGLRRQAGGAGHAPALLRFAVDLTGAEAGHLLRGTQVAFSLPEGAPAPPPAWHDAAGEALRGRQLLLVPAGALTLFAAPLADAAIVLGLRLANPVHAAVTRERLALILALGAAQADAAQGSVPGLLGRVLPVALAAPPAQAPHRAARALADLLGARRVALALLARGRIRTLAVSDHADLALHSDLGRHLAAILGEAADGAIGDAAAGQAARAYQAAMGARLLAASASGPVALLIETDAAPPDQRLVAALAAGLAPLARTRAESPARTRFGAWHLLAILALAVGAAAVWPRPAEIEAPFVLAPREKHIITAPFDSVIEAAPLEPGDAVRAGTTLVARLATRELTLELAAARARAANDRREADIARARGQPAAEQIASLSSERAEAQVALLEHRIALAEVRAPADGVVIAGDLRRSLGQPVSRGQVLIEVAPADALRAEVLVLDADSARLVAGAAVTLAPAADPSRRIAGTITRILPMAEPVGGRNVVRALADLPAGTGLRAGTEGQARIEAGTTSWLMWAVGDVIRAARARLWL